MAENHNATCKICGKSYYACMSCADTMKLHPFKSFTDTSEHFKVFQVVRGLSTGVYTKEEAKEKFKNVNLKDIESFIPHIRDIIKDVLKEEKVVDEITEEIENTVVNDIKIEVEKVKVVDNIVKPTVSRKKNYKMETE